MPTPALTLPQLAARRARMLGHDDAHCPPAPVPDDVRPGYVAPTGDAILTPGGAALVTSSQKAA